MAMKALGNQMTRIVRVNRKKLVETLVENKEAHIKQFKEAMDGYKATALAKIAEAFDGLDKKLMKRRDELIQHVGSFSPEKSSEFSDQFVILNNVYVNLKVPVSYEDAYNAAIDMAMFDTRDELELSGAEFQCFCRDVWDWSYEFAAVTQSYSGHK